MDQMQKTVLSMMYLLHDGKSVMRLKLAGVFQPITEEVILIGCAKFPEAEFLKSPKNAFNRHHQTLLVIHNGSNTVQIRTHVFRLWRIEQEKAPIRKDRSGPKIRFLIAIQINIHITNQLLSNISNLRTARSFNSLNQLLVCPDSVQRFQMLQIHFSNFISLTR